VLEDITSLFTNYFKIKDDYDILEVKHTRATIEKDKELLNLQTELEYVTDMLGHVKSQLRDGRSSTDWFDSTANMTNDKSKMLDQTNEKVFIHYQEAFEVNV
jgi:hypothetical protein